MLAPTIGDKEWPSSTPLYVSRDWDNSTIITPEPRDKRSFSTFGYKILFWENILYVWDYSYPWKKLVEKNCLRVFFHGCEKLQKCLVDILLKIVDYWEITLIHKMLT